MMDRHTKMNAKVLLIWVLCLAVILLLWGCKSGKAVSRNGLVVDSAAQSEETTIIEVVAGNAATTNKQSANNERGKNESPKAERGKRWRFAAQRPVEPTIADKECAGVVADLIENGGGVVKITRKGKTTSTVDKQQQQLNREIQRRNDWLFNLGVVVAVAVGMWVWGKLKK